MSKGKKPTNKEIVESFFYAPLDQTKSTFPCHCKGTLKAYGGSDSYLMAKCENGHSVVIAWAFLVEAPNVFMNFKVVRGLDDKQ